MTTIIEAAREQRLRRLARRIGYSLVKSRVRNPHFDNQGGYRVIWPERNALIRGEKFNLTLDDVEAFLVEASLKD